MWALDLGLEGAEGTVLVQIMVAIPFELNAFAGLGLDRKSVV